MFLQRCAKIAMDIMMIAVLVLLADTNNITPIIMLQNQSLREAMGIIAMTGIFMVMIYRRAGLAALDYMELMDIRLAAAMAIMVIRRLDMEAGMVTHPLATHLVIVLITGIGNFIFI